MDFVKSPLGGEGIEVPLVTSMVIGPGADEWLQYRDRAPFIDTDGRLDISSSQDDIAGFVQCWLYFGLLAVVSNTTINGHDFSTPGKHWPIVVSSELVGSAIIDMQRSVLRLPQKQRAHIFQRHKTTLVKADEAARWVASYSTRSNSDILDLILLSVKVLIGTICHAFNFVHDGMFEKMYADSLQWYSVAERRGDQSTAADRALKTKMAENGWCVHQIHKVLSTFSYQTAYYFARLPRPGSARVGHETCTKSSCRGWNSKPGRTSTRHAMEACTCSIISISSFDVAGVIQSGQIPLVSIEEDAHGSPTLKLHTKERSSKYVAISHVWTDGLGNAFENGLPACQLRMLQTYFEHISRDSSSWSPLATTTAHTLFWMDTLCIPVQMRPPAIPFPDEVLNDIKAEAINKMNTVYSSSSHTLILDAEMRMIPMSADDTTKLAYSQCCGWTTRSWTLQEGCLPPVTVYALADGIYSHKGRRFNRHFRLWRVNRIVRFTLGFLKRQLDNSRFVVSLRGLDTVVRPFDFSVNHEICTSSSTRSFSIWDAYNADTYARKKFLVRNRYAEIWNELLDRVSSQPADIPAIFANLLGVSAYEVLKRTSEQEQVALIIRQQKVLPVEILFNTGLRLQRKLHITRSRLRSTSQRQQSPAVVEAIPEEWIGLLELPEPQAQIFKNGWVPATIGGDKYLQPLVGQIYLQVLEDCFQIHENGKERYAAMFTMERPDIPMPKFLLEVKHHPTNNRLATRTRLISVDIAVNPSTHNAQERSEETMLGHCFMYDPGSQMAMSKGLVNCAPGVHLVILRRSNGRLVTRYSGPIRLGRVAEERDSSEGLPVVECKCNCEGSREFVDILYDAEDLGPLLSTKTDSPNEMFQEHWFNPIATFVTHYYISGALEPYNGTIRPRIVTAALLIMPVMVYSYQSVIVKRAAERLFLEPLNDRGQLQQPFKSLPRRILHCIDTVIVAYWSVILFGPTLDGLFWLILKGSEGKNSIIPSKIDLFLRLNIVVQAYLCIWSIDTHSKAARTLLWCNTCVVLVVYATYYFITTGVFLQFFNFLFNLLFNSLLFSIALVFVSKDL